MVQKFFFGGHEIVRRYLRVSCWSLVLFLLFPVLLLLSFLIIVFDGRPVFFTQDRVGLDGKIFRIFKFRTMVLDVGPEEVEDNYRITKLGFWLRALCLDELPQIINLIKGEMNLIGPRPLLPSSLNSTPSWALPRFTIIPGVTGLAQVKGRSSLGWRNKFKYDVFYVTHNCMALRLYVIYHTIIIVAKSLADRSLAQVQAPL